MLAGTSYDTAYLATPDQAIRRGLYINDMLACLAKIGNPSWKASKRGYKKPLVSYANVPSSAHALIIRRPEDSFGHWIVREQESIYDPEFPTPCNLATYTRQEWEIIRVILPR
jgi:hypothetical protein